MVGQVAYVIGQPIAHSLSPTMHNAAFAALGIDARYEAIEIAAVDLSRWIQSIRRPDLLGFNVTVPHKEAVAREVDRLEGDAQETGAVNTVMVDRESSSGWKLIGTNTDTIGFRRSLIEEAGVSLQGQRILLLGAGGAARAIAYAALKDGAADLVVANRDETRARRLVKQLFRVNTSTQTRAIAMTDPSLAEELATATLVVNATTVGLGTDEMPVDPARITGMVVDIVYRPLKTAFLRAAEEHGLRVLGGLGMLVYQAAAAFELWTGATAPIDIMRNATERALASQDR
ncbi:MAG: Shikimate 5-dehydrogenase alpha [Chloroflexi bacterium]|nr:Shikimate 5-dehydrogenase alpha [Chloroflexota bacterium]